MMLEDRIKLEPGLYGLTDEQINHLRRTRDLGQQAGERLQEYYQMVNAERDRIIPILRKAREGSNHDTTVDFG